MELRVLKYFLAIAREQGITRAAEVLHITQPTLSRQIAELEEELGVQLFDRSGRCIQLTDEGILFRRRAMEILELVDRTREEMTEQDERIEGTVSIGCGVLHAFQTLAEVMNWFQSAKQPLNIPFTSNLSTNAAMLVAHHLAVAIIALGSQPYADPAKIALRPLAPELAETAILAWRRQQPYTRAVKKFIAFAQEEIPRISTKPVA